MKFWIGIDPGAKRIGIARADPLGLLASPVEIVDRVEAVLARLSAGAGEIAGVVVGLPRNMDGSYGPMARRSYQFAQRLRAATPVPVVLWDERLTSREVRARRREAGLSVSRPDDAAAAAVLLQSYLDAGRPLRSDPAELLAMGASWPPLEGASQDARNDGGGRA
jgi:putative Holliday junction resolvase